MDKVQHFEFAADEPERAQKFYSEVFGWKIEKMDNDGMEYWGITTGSVGDNGRGNEVNTIGGGMRKREGPNQGSTVYVSVDDIEATFEKVVAQGGKIIMTKTPVGPDKDKPYGYIGVLEDTEGNNIGMWADK